MTTGFLSDERCFWHSGGNYMFTAPVRGHVQPGGQYPESPESKRRLRNLLEATGLIRQLAQCTAEPATEEELLRVHSRRYVDAFRALSDAEGGELGPRAPFGPGGYEIAALSAGLARDAVCAVLRGTFRNAYALSRPPGHHAMPDSSSGFCLFANIAVAIEAARAAGLAQRFAVVDWDVHHGNGTEAIFYQDPDVLTISIHQDRCFPLDTGRVEDRGAGPGLGTNANIPLPPGSGHAQYLEAVDRIVVPLLDRFRPEIIIVACGFDASIYDPLARMMATGETFRDMTKSLKTAADRLCNGRLAMVHEGGYSEYHVPFCGHAVIEELSGSDIRAEDPSLPANIARQPDAAFAAFVSSCLDRTAAGLDI